MYTIFKNGRMVCVIDADEVKMDLTNPNEPVAIFVKGDREGVEVEDDDGTPYIEWQDKKNKHRLERIRQRKLHPHHGGFRGGHISEEIPDEARVHRERKQRNKDEKDRQDKRDRDEKDKKDKQDREDKVKKDTEKNTNKDDKHKKNG